MRDGWESTSPLSVVSGEGEEEVCGDVQPQGHECTSELTTAIVTKGCDYPCWGYLPTYLPS